ncbi:MAG: zf-HC2 domain-containing protein [Candidatus Ratteibacteria bacterium]
MKKCKNFEEKIILYIENKLLGFEKKEIEKHLEICERCSSYFEYVNELIYNAEKTLNQNYWDELKEKILKKIEKYKEMVFLRVFRIKKFILCFTSIFILIFVFLNIFQDHINLVKHFHLFKNYQIIKNLDDLKELIALEEENYE